MGNGGSLLPMPAAATTPDDDDRRRKLGFCITKYSPCLSNVLRISDHQLKTLKTEFHKYLSCVRSTAIQPHDIQSKYPSLHDKHLPNIHSKSADVNNLMDLFECLMYFFTSFTGMHHSGLVHVGVRTNAKMKVGSVEMLNVHWEVLKYKWPKMDRQECATTNRK